MTREDFIKKIMFPVDGDPNGIRLNFNLVQQSVLKEFEDNKSFIVMSPRQSGRAVSIISNLLYEVYNGSCINTIIIGRTLDSAKSFQRSFNNIAELLAPSLFNDNIAREVYNFKNKKILYKSASSLKNIPLNSRQDTRLIILDAAFIEDNTPLFEVIQGWKTVIMETVPTHQSFNSEFVRNLVEYNGLKVFDILKYNYKQVGFDQKWLDNQKNMFGDTFIFRSEILLEWF